MTYNVSSGTLNTTILYHLVVVAQMPVRVQLEKGLYLYMHCLLRLSHDSVAVFLASDNTADIELSEVKWTSNFRGLLSS